MQTLIIDLKKNPEIADLVADKEPGDLIDLHCSIKAADDQTLTLTVNEAEEGKEPDEEEKAPEGDTTTPPGASQDGPQAGAGPDAMGMTGAETAAM